MGKKAGEMAFKEFFEEARKKGVGIEGLEDWILNALRSEGFTDEEIHNMKMEKAWGFTLDTISVFIDQSMTEIGMVLEQRIMTPQQLRILNKFVEVFKPELEGMVKELEKELEKKQKKKKKGG